MVSYPLSQSTVQLSGNNTIQTAVSTNILITVGPTPVGAVQMLSVKEQRRIAMIDEVGTDGHINSVPNQSTNITGQCKRVRYDRMRIAEAFGRSYIHAASQRFPFNLVIIDTFNGNALNPSDTSQDIITTIRSVWISGLSYEYQTSDWVIYDTMDWEAEVISSVLGTGSVPAAQGGTRNIPLSMASPTSNIEQAADTGLIWGGSLSAPGLVSSFLPF